MPSSCDGPDDEELTTGTNMRPSPPRWAVLLVVLALATVGCDRLVRVDGVAEVDLAAPVQTSVVLDAAGGELARLHAEQDREVVPLRRIPAALRDAVIAVEDARFYEHGGVDGRAVARAFVTNAREGRVAQGGSTLTQQLAKNVVTGDELSLDRKVAEASVALQLERRFTKDEILERYLNTVYFGDGAYGVQAAAQSFFGVDAGALDLPQAALLAGVLAGPSRYDPRRYPERARARRDLVLERMVEEDLLTPGAADGARSAPLEVAAADGQSWRAPYFVDHVLRLLQHDDDFAFLGPDPESRADRLFREGLRIETTLHPGWQRAAERAVEEVLSYPQDPAAALVASDPSTGAVRALVGGRDWHDSDDPSARYNLATLARRQPGSAFKPLVLAAALEQGHTLDERFPGGPAVTLEPLEAGQPPWEVTNYADTDPGPVDLRTATALSVNTVYARLVHDLGPQGVVDLARAAGITAPLRPLPAIALGAQEVSPLELTTVAGTLASGGVRREPWVVTRVLDADGGLLYEAPVADGERALSETTTHGVTDALQAVVHHGTGERADLRRPVAGKTGTSQDGADAWFMGYTPDLAAAVWVGFPRGRVPMSPPRTRAPVEGGSWPAEIFGRFGLRALADTPASPFPVPAAHLVHVEVDTRGECLPTVFTPITAIGTRSYEPGSEPTQPCPAPEEPPTVDVPRVEGMPVDVAERQLRAAGFRVERRERYSPSLPPGYVTRQDPGAGADRPLDAGFVAVLDVATAERGEVVVPDVLGLPVAQARSALEDAGLRVELVTGCAGEDPSPQDVCTGAVERPGQVWEVEPTAGTALSEGTAVRLAAYPG